VKKSTFKRAGVIQRKTLNPETGMVVSKTKRVVARSKEARERRARKRVLKLAKTHNFPMPPKAWMRDTPRWGSKVQRYEREFGTDAVVFLWKEYTVRAKADRRCPGMCGLERRLCGVNTGCDELVKLGWVRIEEAGRIHRPFCWWFNPKQPKDLLIIQQYRPVTPVPPEPILLTTPPQGVENLLVCEYCGKTVKELIGRDHKACVDCFA
jgi:hypothetical protein